MMLSQAQQSFTQRTPEEIYACSEQAQRLSYFYSSNKVISSGQAVSDFFRHFHQYSLPQQEKFLQQLLSGLRAVSTNAYLLNRFKCTYQTSLVEQIVSLLMQNVGNYLIFNLLLQTLQELLPFSTLDHSSIRTAISKVIENHHQGVVEAAQLFSASTIFKSWLQAKVNADKDPARMMVFHGSPGLELLPSYTNKNSLNWMLKEGFTLLFWIHPQNLKFGAEAPLPKLFTFYAPQNGGLEAYMVDHKIYYRILGAKYTEPQIGSNGVPLAELEPGKWNFVCFEHEGPRTLHKSKLKCYVNRQKANVVGLDPPKISSSTPTKYLLFDRIYCRASSVCLFPLPIGSEEVEEFSRSMRSVEHVRNPKAWLFQLRNGRLFERSGLAVAHSYVFDRNLGMDLEQALPLLHLLQYQKGADNRYPTVNQILSILVLFLRQSARNQQTAHKQGYFKIMSQLICALDGSHFDETSINSLLHIKHTITDQQLRDQYFSDILWPLLNAPLPLARKEEILEVIKTAFTQNIAHYSHHIGLDQMLNVLQKLQGSSLNCCEKHFKIAYNKFEKAVEGQQHYGQEKKAQSYVLTLIEYSFQNTSIKYAHQVYKLCSVLALKLSPCLTLQLISLIRRLIGQKFGQRMSEGQTKEIIKYFNDKKVHLIFIHLIENNFFAEIKAESVKLIYSLLIRKNPAQEATISHLVSKALWKINEFPVQSAPPTPPLKEEPPLLKNIEEEQQQFVPVGPQAPALSNRLKGKKTFDFGFVNDTKPSRPLEIMEEEKTNQPDVPVEEPLILAPVEKKGKKFALSINTQKINEMYSFGGEKGTQIMVSEEEGQEQLEKIRRLAKKCILAMNGSLIEKSQPHVAELPKRGGYMAPPMTTTNQAAASRKGNFKLKLISEEEQGSQASIPTPQAHRKSKSPTSIKSSSEQNLLTLYNSLLECCLGVSFQTSLITDSKIQVPSILSIFFKWIPQTDLETKFLNDLEIMLEGSDNMQAVIELPQLYDFLFELIYKCLLFETMRDKRIYAEKLENIIKTVFSHIFNEDPNAFAKFSFILNWAESKRQQHYEPRCLLLTTRYALLLILQCISQDLLMNTANNSLKERNFQQIATVLDTLRKVIPEGLVDQVSIDECQRVMFLEQVELPASLTPYFKSDWVDQSLYQRYLFLYKKFYCTQYYKKGLKQFNEKGDMLDFLRANGTTQLISESQYYMRNNFLISLIEIQRSMMVEVQKKQPSQADEYGQEAVWQSILLVVLAQFNKDKLMKSHRSQMILTFLKNCKLLAERGVERIVQIVPMLSILKHFISLSSMQKKGGPANTQILDDIIGNYIPQYLLNMGKTDLESFILHFAEVWIPNENHYKKVHSEMFLAYQDRLKRDEEVNFIEFISTVIEQENERRQYTELITQAYSRTALNQFRKMWYGLRLYGSSWTHPRLSWQNDSLYTKSTYAYEKYEPSPFYQYKVGKQFGKSKGRYFLKPKLIEPKAFQNSSQQFQQRQYNLDKALTFLSQRLIIGASKKGWISSKGQDSLYFTMGFKRVRIINTLTFRTGSLAIINDCLVFVGAFQTQKHSHLAIDQYKVKFNKTLHKTWPLEYIRQIFKRRYVNKRKSVQINWIYNKSLLLDFQNEEESQEFCKKIMKLKNKCVNLSFAGKSLEPKKLVEGQQYLKKWVNHQLGTFDYLMELNTIAGRAFSDLTQYPVFPWTLNNFEESKCVIAESSMRDLTAPMGANGTEDRIHNFEERYEMMQVEDEYATNFHYGTHYSSPGIVYHFLVRLSPYTEGSILLQSGKFDFADRLFFSLADSYKNATSQYSDVRELLPELYSIPQSYLNVNGLGLGLMQNKKRVHNVELPPWCRQNPYLFVCQMKRFLEDERVSKHIHQWIDLIFGYKQRGEQAARALNSFYYLTYQDALPWHALEDGKDIEALESQIVNFGQTPSQIFSKPHPQRHSLANIKNYRLITDPEAELKVYRPTKNAREDYRAPAIVNLMRQQDESIIFMKWLTDSKLVFVRRSGEVIFYKCSPNPNQINKIPFQCTVEKEKKVERVRKSHFDPSQFYDPSLVTTSFPVDLIAGGHTLCLGGLSDGKLSLIDVDTGSSLHTYQSHQETISCLKADPRQNFLVSGDTRGNVVMWQIKTNSNNISKLVQKKVIKDQHGQITSIFFSNQLQCVAIASLDGSVFLYNMITGKRVRVYYHPKRLAINEVVITSNPLAAILLFCNADNTLYSYSINGQLIARHLDKHHDYFMNPAVVKDSKGFEYLLFGNEKSEIKMRVLPFLEVPVKNSFKVAKSACVNRLCANKHSRFLVSGCSDGDLTVITDPNLIAPS